MGNPWGGDQESTTFVKVYYVGKHNHDFVILDRSRVCTNNSCRTGSLPTSRWRIVRRVLESAIVLWRVNAYGGLFPPNFWSLSRHNGTSFNAPGSSLNLFCQTRRIRGVTTSQLHARCDAGIPGSLVQDNFITAVSAFREANLLIIVHILSCQLTKNRDVSARKKWVEHATIKAVLLLFGMVCSADDDCRIVLIIAPCVGDGFEANLGAETPKMELCTDRAIFGTSDLQDSDRVSETAVDWCRHPNRKSHLAVCKRYINNQILLMKVETMGSHLHTPMLLQAKD